MFGVQHIAFVEMFCTFRTIFQHGTHGCVTVDVGIFTFDVTVCCIFVCDVFESFHQTIVHVSDSCTFCSVQDVCFCCTHIAVVDQDAFNAVLDLFYCRGCDTFFFESVGYFMSKAQAYTVIFCTNCCLESFIDSAGNFVDVEEYLAAVSFCDCCDHGGHSFLSVLRISGLFCIISNTISCVIICFLKHIYCILQRKKLQGEHKILCIYMKNTQKQRKISCLNIG